MESSSNFHHHLVNKDFIEELKQKYYELFKRLYGPCGSALLLRNNGGEDFHILSSKLCIEQISFKHPVANLISAVVKAQNDIYGTHGSFVALLSSGLLFRLLNLDMQQSSMIAISQSIIEFVEQFLCSNNMAISHKLNYSNLDDLIPFVKSLLSSKVNYSLSEIEKNQLFHLIAKLFVEILPSNERSCELNSFHIMSLEGVPSSLSDIKPGLLYREIDENDCIYQRIATNFSQKSNYKIALFNCPMAKESPDGLSLKEDSYVLLNQSLIDNLSRFLGKNCVKIIANQKFIDPIVKFELERVGFLVLESLGTRLMKSLQKMSDGIPFDVFNPSTDDGRFGYVGSLSSVEIHNKRFVLLSPSYGRGAATLCLGGLNRHVTLHLEVSRS